MGRYHAARAKRMDLLDHSVKNLKTRKDHVRRVCSELIEGMRQQAGAALTHTNC